MELLNCYAQPCETDFIRGLTIRYLRNSVNKIVSRNARKPTFKRGVAFMQTSRLLEQDIVLLAQPSLIELFGRAGAQFLNQLHYWLENPGCGENHQGKKWIYNTESAWSQQLKLSTRQFRRYVSSLTQKGIISVAKLHSHKSNRTNYFSINYESLEKLISGADNSSQLSQTSSFAHEDILSASSGQSGPFYIETKITNKDFNKSDAESKKLTGQGAVSEAEQVKQVERVKKSISKIEKNRVGEDKTSQDDHFMKQQFKTSTAQDMLEIWNTVLGEKSQATMSKDLAPQLVSAYSTKFEKDLNQWRRYCELIKTSEYLMKERFDLSLFWALKFSTIDRLRAGGLGVKPTSLSAASESIANESQIDEMITALNESETTKALRRTIAQAVGSANYLSWFHQASFVEQEGKILLVAPNAFVESKWEELFPWINKENIA